MHAFTSLRSVSFSGLARTTASKSSSASSNLPMFERACARRWNPLTYPGSFAIAADASFSASAWSPSLSFAAARLARRIAAVFGSPAATHIFTAAS